MNTESRNQNPVETQAAQRVRELLIADARSKFAATLAEVQQEQEYFTLRISSATPPHA
jgi:hypothetical protein